MTSVSTLKHSLTLSAILVLGIYFLYRTASFPFGLEALECLLSFVILIATIILVIKFRHKLSNNFSISNISSGLFIGLLWTIEISINNFIHPTLPSRDIIDNIFWGLIAFLILTIAIRFSIKSKKIFVGIKSGFLTGLASGAIACLTALLLITLGMQLILTDPLNIREWTDMKSSTHYPSMSVYFAFQTLAGAIMHLVILGVVMGLLLGVLGGLIGKIISSLRKNNVSN